MKTIRIDKDFTTNYAKALESCDAVYIRVVFSKPHCSKIWVKAIFNKTEKNGQICTRYYNYHTGRMNSRIYTDFEKMMEDYDKFATKMIKKGYKVNVDNSSHL